MTVILEKSFICLALLATFPLFFLDKEILGFRRFAWLIAFTTGLSVTLILDPNEELAQFLDKITMACVSVTIVPHFLELVKENLWLGIGMIPPFLLVLQLSLETSIDSVDFWKLRAFLHVGLFLPYLNHLPSDPPAPEEAGESDSTENIVSEKATTTQNQATEKKTSTKKGKTNKKKKQ